MPLGPPAVRLFKLADADIPGAIATARNEDRLSRAYGTTDLFATAGNTQPVKCIPMPFYLDL